MINPAKRLFLIFIFINQSQHKPIQQKKLFLCTNIIAAIEKTVKQNQRLYKKGFPVSEIVQLPSSISVSSSLASQPQ